MEELMIHGINTIVGATASMSIYFHRGDYHYDVKREIFVSEGNGISAKIIKHFPKYKHISSAVDHFLEGVGGTLLLGGILGIVQYQIEEKIGKDVTAMLPYYFSATSLAFKKIGWDLNSVAKRIKTYDIGDKLQVTADVASISSTLFVLNQYL